MLGDEQVVQRAMDAAEEQARVAPVIDVGERIDMFEQAPRRPGVVAREGGEVRAGVHDGIRRPATGAARAAPCPRSMVPAAQAAQLLEGIEVAVTVQQRVVVLDAVARDEQSIVLRTVMPWTRRPR